MTRSGSRRRRRKATETGSPADGEPVFLAVGRITKPHGVRGEMKFVVLTDFPERLVAGKQVYVGREYEPMTIGALRMTGRKGILQLEEIDIPEAVELYRNQEVYVRTEDIPPLPEGEFYHHQLLGLQVVTEDNQDLGKIAEIIETGANDVFVVRPESGPDVLLPGIDDVILKIDLDTRTIQVRLLDGLLG